jgi:chloramphenicol 3-O-phosphotransferase
MAQLDGTLLEIRIGRMRHSVAARATAGVDVIVDDVIHDRRVLAAAVAALHDAPVLFVGLRLPREVAEQS